MTITQLLNHLISVKLGIGEASTWGRQKWACGFALFIVLYVMYVYISFPFWNCGFIFLITQWSFVLHPLPFISKDKGSFEVRFVETYILCQVLIQFY